MSYERHLFVSLPSERPATPFEWPLTVPETLHHIKTVARLRPGERVRLIDPEQDMFGIAALQTVQKTTAVFRVESVTPLPAPPQPRVTLAIALIKEQRWDWLLQKATELGVSRIQPVLAERSVIRLSSKDWPGKQARWQAIAQAAAEQSEGFFIPPVSIPMSVANLCGDACTTGMHGIVLQEQGEGRAALQALLPRYRQAAELILAIGPEGAWTPGESQLFAEAGFPSASLGPRILRSETAAIAALSIAMHLLSG